MISENIQRIFPIYLEEHEKFQTDAFMFIRVKFVCSLYEFVQFKPTLPMLTFNL